MCRMSFQKSCLQMVCRFSPHRAPAAGLCKFLTVAYQISTAKAWQLAVDVAAVYLVGRCASCRQVWRCVSLQGPVTVHPKKHSWRLLLRPCSRAH